jgi:uncharacterized protein (DUF111 family)
LVLTNEIREKLKKKKAAIWLVEVDHLSGESLGLVVQKILGLGAMNVHIIPTITKKNRPGHILFLDISNPAKSKKIEDFLIEELGIPGYHRLLTEHFHETTSTIERVVHAKHGDKSIQMQVKLKVIGSPSKPKFIRVEHESLVSIQREIQSEFKQVISLTALSSLVEVSVRQNLKEIIIDI